MPWGDLGLNLAALLLYPGLLATVVFGLAAEVALALVTAGGGPRAAVALAVARGRAAAAGAGPAALAAALLAIVAATQLAAPFDPVSPVERNLLVAAVASAGASWLAWTRAWTAGAARLALVVQVCWLVALLAPATVSQTLRPEALAAVALPAQLPLKAGAALLALVCLPGLLHLHADLAPGGDRGTDVAAGVRLLLWFPLCGLVASVYPPPATDDVAGLARFVVTCAVVAAAAIGGGALFARLPAAATLYVRTAVLIAALVAVAAVVTSAVS